MRRLSVNQAFHSPLMDPMLEEFGQLSGAMRYHRPQINWISNVTGREIGRHDEVDGRYWVRQIREPVRFAAGLERMSELGCELYVEIGPQATLLGLGGRVLERNEAAEWFASLREGRGAREQMLESVGRLWLAGAEVDWEEVCGGAGRQRIILPTYPFQRQRYWLPNLPKPSEQTAA